jgi:hypothetical protein
MFFFFFFFLERNRAEPLVNPNLQWMILDGKFDTKAAIKNTFEFHSDWTYKKIVFFPQLKSPQGGSKETEFEESETSHQRKKFGLPEPSRILTAFSTLSKSITSPLQPKLAGFRETEFEESKKSTHSAEQLVCDTARCYQDHPKQDESNTVLKELEKWDKDEEFKEFEEFEFYRLSNCSALSLRVFCDVPFQESNDAIYIVFGKKETTDQPWPKHKNAGNVSIVIVQKKTIILLDEFQKTGKIEEQFFKLEVAKKIVLDLLKIAFDYAISEDAILKTLCFSEDDCSDFFTGSGGKSDSRGKFDSKDVSACREKLFSFQEKAHNEKVHLLRLSAINQEGKFKRTSERQHMHYEILRSHQFMSLSEFLYCNQLDQSGQRDPTEFQKNAVAGIICLYFQRNFEMAEKIKQKAKEPKEIGLAFIKTFLPKLVPIFQDQKHFNSKETILEHIRELMKPQCEFMTETEKEEFFSKVVDDLYASHYAGPPDGNWKSQHQKVILKDAVWAKGINNNNIVFGLFMNNI